MQKLLFLLLSFVVLASSTVAAANQAPLMRSVATQDMHGSVVPCQEEKLCEQEAHQCCQLLAIETQHSVNQAAPLWKLMFVSTLGSAHGHSSPPIKPPRQ